MRVCHAANLDLLFEISVEPLDTRYQLCRDNNETEIMIPFLVVLPLWRDSVRDELVEFFDTHDLGECWDQMPEVHFEVDIKKRMHLFAIDGELASKLTQIAGAKQIVSQKLINSWLREKIRGQESGEVVGLFSEQGRTIGRANL